LSALASFAAVFLLCLLAGCHLTRRFSFPFSIRFAAGAAIVSQVVFLFLVCSLAKPLIVGSAAALYAAFALWRLRPSFPRLHPPAIPRLLWPFFLAYSALYLIYALAPEIQPDGYTYHLGLVKQWRNTGALSPLVGFYEMLPQGLEMLFLLNSLFGGGGEKLLHALFIALGALLIGNLSRHFQLTPWPPMLLWFCSPVVGVTGTAAYNDVALGFAALCVFYLLLTDHPRWAALLAGWCYAIKLPGLVFVAAVLLFLALRRRWRDAVAATFLAALMVAPWMIRTAYLSGNPVAPLYNRWFPNPHFHIDTEEVTVQFLRTYDVDWLHRWWEVTVAGQKTTGLLGPVFLLAPLVFLLLRRRDGRLLLLALAVALIPWFGNAGTRFLIPALGFLCLALAMALPRPAIAALALLHAVLSLPPLIPLYADPYAWRLRHLPWRVVFHLESPTDYLARELWEYRVARMVDRHVPPNQLVLDLLGLPDIYTHTRPLRSWQYAPADHAYDALRTAAEFDASALRSLSATWSPTPVRAFRITNNAASNFPWGLQEVAFLAGGERLRPRSNWLLSAEPNPWDAPLALDGNLATRYHGWQERRPGMFWEVEFPAPLPLSGIRLTAHPADAEALSYSIQLPSGAWQPLPIRPLVTTPPAVSLRPQATNFVKRLGFRYLLIRVAEDTSKPFGLAIVDHPGDWRLSLLERLDGAWLLQIRD
jgi:hypothetical protein